MARKKKIPNVRTVRSNTPDVLDLRKVNPRGRLDVLAANAIEKFADKVPELLPIVNEKRGVIHCALNEQLGPHTLGVNLVELINEVQPYLPLLGAIAQSTINNYRAKGSSDKQGVGQ